MTTPPPADSPDSAAAWRLGPVWLIETRDGAVRYWGRWDGRFDCWDGLGRTVTPDRALLGRLGRWIDPDGCRDDDWYLGRAAWAAYWSLVPTAVRLEAARLPPDKQWPFLRSRWVAQRRDAGAIADQWPIRIGAVVAAPVGSL